MTNRDQRQADRIQRQTDEFNALTKLVEQDRRLKMTAIVDDDYPSVRNDYERELRGFIAALDANGRLDAYAKERDPMTLAPEEQFELATKLAANVGYKLVGEPMERMADNVVNFTPKDRVTTKDVPVGYVIAAAQEAGLREVVVLGFDNAEDEYFASSISDPSRVNWLLDRLKIILLTDSQPG